MLGTDFQSLLANAIGSAKTNLLGNQIPRPQMQPRQLPQLGFPGAMATPPFNPNAGMQQPGQMPYLKDAMMSSVLSPLRRPNYGVPIISPFGQQPQARVPSLPRLGQPMPGLRIPGMFNGRMP